MIARPTTLAALTASEGIAAVRGGAVDPRGWIDALLARARARDPRIHAWTQTADERAERLAGITPVDPLLPLVGLPIGVKDVIDAVGWPTGCNSPIEAGRVPALSAVAVARLETAGAVIIGKTVTTEYAFREPGPTTNPHDTLRTPGGSSSGSAAAVADYQVPVALTTQTGGSTIRPAAFCGVVGYKPPFGSVPTKGLALLAPSLDVIGLHARSVTDAAVVATIMEAAPRVTGAARPPNFALLDPAEPDEIGPDVRTMLGLVADSLRHAGAEVGRAPFPASFRRLDAAHRVIMSVEVAQSFASRYATRSVDLSQSLVAFIERGQATTGQQLAEAHAALALARSELYSLSVDGAILLSAAAPDEAPLGLASTGSPVLNRLWSLLHVGVMALPAGTSSNGMPLGLQLIDPRPGAPTLFAAAAFAERALTPMATKESVT